MRSNKKGHSSTGDAGVRAHAHLHDVQLVAVRGRRGRRRRRLLPLRLEEDDRLRRVGPLPLTTSMKTKVGISEAIR